MRKMLIVDDDPLTQDVMRRIFKSEYEIDSCESVAEYYEKYFRKNYDIIIMDIALKGEKNGFELIKEIKEDESYAGTPIICLTANAQNKARHMALEVGADLFLTKPVTLPDLRDAVKSLIKKEKLNL